MDPVSLKQSSVLKDGSMVVETKILLPAVAQPSVALQDLLSHPQTLPPHPTTWALTPLTHPEPPSHV